MLKVIIDLAAFPQMLKSPSRSLPKHRPFMTAFFTCLQNCCFPIPLLSLLLAHPIVSLKLWRILWALIPFVRQGSYGCVSIRYTDREKVTLLGFMLSAGLAPEGLSLWLRQLELTCAMQCMCSKYVYVLICLCSCITV